jgi:hypothetical protein
MRSTAARVALASVTVSQDPVSAHAQPIVPDAKTPAPAVVRPVDAGVRGLGAGPAGVPVVRHDLEGRGRGAAGVDPVASGSTKAPRSCPARTRSRRTRTSAGR